MWEGGGGGGWGGGGGVGRGGRDRGEGASLVRHLVDISHMLIICREEDVLPVWDLTDRCWLGYVTNCVIQLVFSEDAARVKLSKRDILTVMRRTCQCCKNALYN